MGCCDGFDWKRAMLVAFSEFLGTTILMGVGCMNVTAGQFAGLTFGCAVILAVLAFGHISGAHVNPCVTLGFVVLGIVPWRMSFFYIIGQFFGAAAGYAFPYFAAIRHDSTISKCVTVVHPDITYWQGLILEYVSSVALMLLICGVIDVRTSTKTGGLSLKIGFGLSSIFMSVGALTGASINTTRTIIPSIYNNIWDDHWIFWLGPIAGTTSAAALYRFVFKLSAEEEDKIREEALPL